MRWPDPLMCKGITAKKILALCVAAFVLSGCGLHGFKVNSAAMEPTIKRGRVVLINKAYYRTHPVQRFDIVAVKDPDGRKADGGKEAIYINRVIGLGGERVEINGGEVFINGQKLNETFRSFPPPEDFGPLVVPAGEFFLLGDNRPNSYDSRHWKRSTVRESDIIGVTAIK